MTIHVAVAVIEDDFGRVLLSRRPSHVHQGGLWEFPGGKRDPGEELSQALAREIDEELGLRVEAHHPLIRVQHDYGDKRVLLDVHRITCWSGQPAGREGQAIRWVPRQELASYPMPAADRPIVTALRLPDRYLIASGEALNDLSHFSLRLETALAAGVRLVQLRPESLLPRQWRPLLNRALELCGRFQADLLLNSRVGLPADPADGVGIHLTGRDLMSFTQPPTVGGYLAASCHSLAELKQAESLGADFAVLSPVLPTTSHPGAQTLGWDLFAEWVEQVNLPVYALGGVGDCLPEVAWQRGGQGIAGISGFW